MTTKSYVGVNRVTDTRRAWPALDSIHCARFAGHLNQGLFQNSPDTTLNDLWFFWTTSGEKIRADNSLGSMIITVKLPEESLEGGSGGLTPMGDHPMSWGRRMAAGGRVFYTSVGHRVEHYLGGPKNPRFLRRQIYNAILWTAKYDSLSQATMPWSCWASTAAAWRSARGVDPRAKDTFSKTCGPAFMPWPSPPAKAIRPA